MAVRGVSFDAMNLFGIGFPEAGLVMVLALILVGPQRFPEIARQAGRWYRTARAFTDAVMQDVRAAVDEIEDELGVEGGDLQPIRELTDLRRDLADAIQGTADRQAAASAEEPPVGQITAPSPPPESETPTAVPSATEPPQAFVPEPSSSDGRRGA